MDAQDALSIGRLVDAIRDGAGPEAHEAALTLGMLIDRERARRPAGSDAGVREVLGPEADARRLSGAEVEEAVSGLSQYVETAESPHPTAVWALGKSLDPRTVPVLAGVVERLLEADEAAAAVYNALVGLTAFGEEAPVPVFRLAAERGGEEIRQVAERFLSALRSPG